MPQPLTLTDMFRLPPGESEAEASIVLAIDAGRSRTWQDRRPRTTKNRVNWDFYNGQQNWAHKQDSQSRIFLPDLPMFVEQVCSSIERQLTEFSDWFGIEKVGPVALLDPNTMRRILLTKMERLYVPGDPADNSRSFQTVLADGVKQALMESEIVLKVTGQTVQRPVFHLIAKADQNPLEPSGVDPEGPASHAKYLRGQVEVSQAVQRGFKLNIEVVPFEDFYPDMSPASLWCIHEVTAHISELYDNPDYDPAKIERLSKQAQVAEERLTKLARQGQRVEMHDPWLVRVQEFWGDLPDPKTGRIMERNKLITKVGPELLRPPSRNPLWHQRKPFVRAPLFRTPNSPIHNAMMDRAVPVAEAQNEVFSLMVDSGISSVAGIKQYHPDLIQNADDLGKGMFPGFTAVMKEGVSPDAEFMKRVDEQPNLQHAGEMMARLGGALQQAMAINDVLVGQLPARQVKATEIVEAQQASNNLFESMGVRLERTVVEPALELAWMTMWQYMDDLTDVELIQIVGKERAEALMHITPEERFVLFANNVRFRATGLRQQAHNIRQFQKIQTLVQTLFTNPALAVLWNMTYSPVKVLKELMMSINLDPVKLERDDEDRDLLNPALMGPNPGVAPTAGGGQAPVGAEAGFAEPNPSGDRGPQV